MLPTLTASQRTAILRDLLPTTLGSSEIRSAIAADIRARSIFVSRAANTIFLSNLKTLIERVAAGEMDKATARWLILETLRALRYTPEGGFPDTAPGEVPPAVAGTLQDLTSLRRLNLIVDTQVALCNGRGWQLRGTTPERLDQFPAWELVRTGTRDMPRAWGGLHAGTPPLRANQPDSRPRWTIAGGRLFNHRMIALKGDPVWGELGGSGNFDDALDVDFPPFAFNSGMGWREIDKGECAALGVTGPDGQTIAEWQAMDHPTLLGTQGALPAPVISLRDADPALARNFADQTGAAITGGIATTTANAPEVASRQSAAAAAIRDRMAARLAASIATLQRKYAAAQ